MSIRLRWLGFACFEIVLPSGKVLITDPYISLSPTAPIKLQEVTGADYIAVTHGHFDHITDVGPLVQRFDSKVMCDYQLADPLANFFGFDSRNLIRVTAGTIIVFDDLKVEVKKAEHAPALAVAKEMYKMITGRKPEPGMSLAQVKKTMAPLLPEFFGAAATELMGKMQAVGLNPGGECEALSFVFQTTDNLRIYMHCGAPFEFMSNEVIEAHSNIAILELGPNDPEKMAEFAALSGAEVAIPYHHDHRDYEGVDQTHNKAHEMAKCLAAKSTAHLLDIVHGKWYEIGVRVSST